MSEVGPNVQIGEIVLYRHGEHVIIRLNGDWWNVICATREEARKISEVLEVFASSGIVGDSDDGNDE